MGTIVGRILLRDLSYRQAAQFGDAVANQIRVSLMNRVGGNSWSTWKHRVSTNKRWFEFRPCLKPEIPVVSDIFAGNQVWHHQTVLRCSDRHENMNLSWYLSISTVQGPIGAQSTGYFISPQKPKNKPMSPKLGFFGQGEIGEMSRNYDFHHIPHEHCHKLGSVWRSYLSHLNVILGRFAGEPWGEGAMGRRFWMGLFCI